MTRYKFAKKVVTLSCIMIFLSPTAKAQSVQMKQVFEQLGSTPIVRAQFEQQKKLTSLNKTYVSKGVVLFSKSQGVLWQIQSTVKADLVVTPHKLVQ